jgi:eukaryotic-like serine/threonine-protein kinase
MTFQLLFIKGSDKGKVVNLESGKELIAGRGDECDVKVNDPQVSREHVILKVGQNSVLVVDQKSTWGTIVNGDKQSKCKIISGDIIRLGESELRLIDVTDSTTTTFPPNDSPSSSIFESTADSTDPNAPTLLNVPVDKKKLSQNPELLIGKKIVRYRIGDSIAKGKTGQLFHAVDEKTNRKIAFKVLWPELCDEESEVKRFLRSVETVLPIKHPNIIRLYGAGKTAGYCWMAMEYVEGESMADVINRLGIGGMLDWQYGFRAAMHIARALELAYENKIVHRNITPGNIMIQNENKQVKLGDLILSKAVEGKLKQDITKPGELVGDLPYMSPEQTLGGDVDSRSDIYNLGATVYRLIAGHPPCAGDNPAETIRNIQNKEPEAPTIKQLSIPSAFEGVILKMLAKDVNNRFQNPTALLRDLKRVATFQGIEDV